MLIIAQEIKTIWTKNSRGGAGASLRNTVPDALKIAPLPANLPEFCIVYQKSECRWKNFEPRNATTEVHELQLKKNHFIACLRFMPHDDHIVMTYDPDMICAGAPDRFFTRKPFTLTPDQSVRVTYNGRFGLYSGWSYHKTVFNILVLNDVRDLDEKCFFNPPQTAYEDIADLW